MSKFDPIRDCKHGHQKGKCDSCDLEQAEKIIEQQQQRIAELERHNKELAATVERLRKTISKLDGNIVSAWEWVCIFNKLRAVSELTPQQNLNAVKREVAKEAFIAGAKDAVAFISQQLRLGKTDIDLDAGLAADKYIERIKDGE